MKKYIYALLFSAFVMAAFNGCSEDEYELGDLSAPTELVINTEIVGQNASNPNGDGSGDVKITLSAKNALSYKIDFDASDPADFVHLPKGTTTKKYTKLGLNTYRITAIAYGRGGTSTTTTKEIAVQSNFTVAASIVNDLTGGTSKTWVVDKSVPGHFGVGPWLGSATPEWWSASVNEKVACCNCFYTATFTFTKNANNSYSLAVASPDGAFTKTGNLTTLPGIPGSGGEGCYAYGGGTSSFSFIPSSTAVPASAPSTKTSILLAGNNTFIGYGALQKEYEILQLTDDFMYLRVQGTETGNAWYLKLIPQ